MFNVIEKFGYGGLILCTLLKYIPTPVITGFTSGIAVSIFSSQVRDLLGLQMDKAGIVHAPFLLLFTLVLAPLMS